MRRFLGLGYTRTRLASCCRLGCLLECAGDAVVLQRPLMTKIQAHALAHPAEVAYKFKSLQIIDDFPWSIVLSVNK